MDQARELVMKIHNHATWIRVLSLEILELSVELLDAQFQIIMHIHQFAACHSLNDFLFLYGPKQMRSSFCGTHLMVCIARQCVFQSFVIQDTALHKNSTSHLQLIFKKITCSSFKRT